MARYDQLLPRRYETNTYQRNPEFERLQSAAGRIPEYASTAQDIVGGIEGAYRPPTTGIASLEAPVEAALRRRLKGGITPQARASVMGAVTRGFGGVTGRLAGGGARRGYFSKQGVATGAGGAPAAAAASGYATAELGLQKQQLQTEGEALRAAEAYKEEMFRPRRALGSFTGEMLRTHRTPSRYGGGDYWKNFASSMGSRSSKPTYSR